MKIVYYENALIYFESFEILDSFEIISRVGRLENCYLHSKLIIYLIWSRSKRMQTHNNCVVIKKLTTFEKKRKKTVI